MKYQKYPEYKESGIEWLGEVPKHWEIKPIKSLFSRTKRTGYKNETLLSVYREYGVIVKSSRDDNRNKESDDLSPYQLVNIGDLVINKMKAWQGSLAISEHRGIVSPAYYIYEPLNSNNLLNNNFVHNQIRSKYFIQSYKNFSKGIRVGQWDLESELFTRLNLFLPPFDEQRKISEFIQREITKIDQLISKQEQLIKLLDEQRKSIISHAVTKGLNPNAPMKDSGVEWLGEIPEHWRILRTKDILNHRNENALENDEIITCFRDGEVTLRKNRRTDGFTNAIQEHGYQHIHSGDLVIHEMDAFAGAIGVSDSDGKSTPVYTVLFPKDIPLNLYFYSDFFRTMARQGFITSLGKGIRVRSTEFRWKESKNVYVVLPPYAEQNEIVNHIQSETNKINNLIDKQKLLIEKLKEYRTSIISHAVTGKIDVREAL